MYCMLQGSPNGHAKTQLDSFGNSATKFQREVPFLEVPKFPPRQNKLDP